jgi:ceramide glucosyltransferase
LVIQTSLPGISVLKPLKNCDGETERCLRSWFVQKYPGPVQILFGAASAEDPVCALVGELQSEFPQADARLVVCSQVLGANAKVSTLRQLEPLVQHPLVVISDADVCAPPDLLVNLAPQFDDPSVGLVTCFFRLANPRTLAMRWEAVFVNADWWSRALLAKAVGKLDFAFGATIALGASQLKAIGGFASLLDYLADDYQLGQQVFKQGKRIELSTVVVECCDPPMGWAQAWKHQLRWARTIRACKPVLFFFSIVENATLFPLLWLVADWSLGAPGASSLAWDPVLPACVLFLTVRVATALRQQKRLTQSNKHFAYWWLVPVTDLLNALIWAAAFCGSRIEWRGERFRVLRGGKLQAEPL